MWLQIIILAASWYNVGSIWLVQVSWRLFAHVGRAEFPAYHRAWWFGLRGIQPVVFPPAIVAAIGSLAQLRWRPPGVAAPVAWLGVLLQVLTFGLTAAWWGRQQAQLADVRLEDGSLNPRYQRLLTTHWLRVALITASGVLQLWMMAQWSAVSRRLSR
jgi:hypothetical protein